MDLILEAQKKYIYLIGICYLLKNVSAFDPIASPLRLLPCFKIKESPTCKSSLFESFQSQFPTAGLNEPDTKVYLFTFKNPDEAEQLDLCGGQLPPNTQYDPSSNTEVFIHGGLDGVCRTAWMREMKEQLFLRGKYNVILVDWSWGNFVDAYTDGMNLRVVGDQVGFVINNIIRQSRAGPEKFHLIGHSFGGVIVGYIGRAVPGLRRITALDPASAPYKNSPPNERITYRDAKIVDVIHVNAGDCFIPTLGDPRVLGHADFYPNGGTVQLGCYIYLLKSILKGDVLYGLLSLALPMFCSHLQSLEYYKVSINPNGCQFVGLAAPNKTRPGSNSWAVMGMDYELYHKNNQTQQGYYLKTKLDCPYYDNSYLGGRQFPFNTSCSEGIL